MSQFAVFLFDILAVDNPMILSRPGNHIECGRNWCEPRVAFFPFWTSSGLDSGPNILILVVDRTFFRLELPLSPYPLTTSSPWTVLMEDLQPDYLCRVLDSSYAEEIHESSDFLPRTLLFLPCVIRYLFWKLYPEKPLKWNGQTECHPERMCWLEWHNCDSCLRFGESHLMLSLKHNNPSLVLLSLLSKIVRWAYSW